MPRIWSLSPSSLSLGFCCHVFMFCFLPTSHMSVRKVAPQEQNRHTHISSPLQVSGSHAGTLKGSEERGASWPRTTLMSAADLVLEVFYASLLVVGQSDARTRLPIKLAKFMHKGVTSSDVNKSDTDAKWANHRQADERRDGSTSPPSTRMGSSPNPSANPSVSIRSPARPKAARTSGATSSGRA